MQSFPITLESLGKLPTWSKFLSINRPMDSSLLDWRRKTARHRCTMTQSKRMYTRARRTGTQCHTCLYWLPSNARRTAALYLRPRSGSKEETSSPCLTLLVAHIGINIALVHIPKGALAILLRVSMAPKILVSCNFVSIVSPICRQHPSWGWESQTLTAEPWISILTLDLVAELNRIGQHSRFGPVD